MWHNSFTCPKRNPSYRSCVTGPDMWLSDCTCSYCHSFNPDVYLTGHQDFELEGPNANGCIFLRSDRQLLPLSQGHFGKIHLDHFSPEQLELFTELLLAGGIYCNKVYLTPYLVGECVGQSERAA
jgi:hypothetical protein